METTVKKWGNSAAVRIPAHAMKAACIEVDAPITLRTEAGKIIIEQRLPAPVLIEELVGAIKPENLHDNIDFGPARGNEAW